MAKKYERKWHSPYYWDGWDEPGSNLSTISRGACPSGAPPSLNCPRCQENPRAGPCPDPAPMAEVMRLFPRVLIICGGFECARHAGGYWPRDVQARIQLVRFEPVNQMLASEVGRSLSVELGIGPTLASDRPRLSAGTQALLRTRVLPLAAHLHAVGLAAQEGVGRVMVLESDMHPIASNALPRPQLDALARVLDNRPWEIFRPTGYHRAFTTSRAGQRNGSCTAACRCHAVAAALPRACEVRAARSRTERTSAGGLSCSTPDYAAADTSLGKGGAERSGSAYCEVNDNDMYGVHSGVYPVFAQQRRCLLADLKDVGRRMPSLSTADLEQRLAALQQSTVQFIDRWIPARFSTIFVAPMVAVQQIKQHSGATDASARFARFCMPRGG